MQRGTTVTDLISISGDVHHIFPKAYLKKNGVDAKGSYNQIANYTYLDTQVNKAIGEDAPNIYFERIRKQCETKKLEIGNISAIEDLKQNLAENAVPEAAMTMTVDDYDLFLQQRRVLMAKMVEKYYKAL